MAENLDDYDSDIARNISPEPESDQDSHDWLSNNNKCGDEGHSSNDGDLDERNPNLEHQMHNRDSDRAGFDVGAPRAEANANSDVDDDSERWLNKPFLSFYEFPDDLKKSSPKSTDNIKGKCKACNKSRSGRISSTSNWVNHLKVQYYYISIYYVVLSILSIILLSGFKTPRFVQGV